MGRNNLGAGAIDRSGRRLTYPKLTGGLPKIKRAQIHSDNVESYPIESPEGNNVKVLDWQAEAYPL